jgi:hypothetical protein
VNGKEKEEWAVVGVAICLDNSDALFQVLGYFQLCFGICHQKGPREPGGTDTEWNTSAFGLC